MGLVANVVLGFMALWCVIYFVVYLHFLTGSYSATNSNNKSDVILTNNNAASLSVPNTAKVDAVDSSFSRDIRSVTSIYVNPILSYSCNSFIKDDLASIITSPQTGLILVVTNESKEDILRTAISIIENSIGVLKSMYIVDDSHQSDVLSWADWHSPPFSDSSIVIMHSSTPRRLGKSESRAYAAASVIKDSSISQIVFADANIIVSPNWLVPLLSTMHHHPNSVVYPAVDILYDSKGQMGFIQGDRAVAGFGWDLGKKWHPLPSESDLHEEDDNDVDEAISPSTHSTFAMTSQFYKDIGGYDGSLASHLPEIELSLRVWMCGGIVVRQPCSRIAQAFSNLFNNVFDSSNRYDVDKSVIAVSHRWMTKQFRELVFQARFLHRLPEKITIALDNLHPEKFTSSKLINAYECLTMEWFMKNVSPTLLSEMSSVKFQFETYLSSDYLSLHLHPLIEQYTKLSNTNIDAATITKISSYKQKYNDPDAVDREAADVLSNYVAEMHQVHMAHVKKTFTCEDESYFGFEGCAKFKDKGGCIDDPAYAMFGCPKTCDKCGQDGTLCIDFYEKKCPQMKANGDCESNKIYMEQNCRWSCGYCQKKGEGKIVQAKAVAVGAGKIDVPTSQSKPESTRFDPYLAARRFLAGDLKDDLESNPCSLNNKPNGDLLSRIPVASEIKNAPKVFCGIYTMEKNHQTNVKATLETWAKHCDGFVAFSTTTDLTVSAMKIEHEGEESYQNMWQKSRSIWKYVASNYAADFDYFLLGGDDMFYIIDNLKAYLNRDEIRTETEKGRGVYIGRKFQPPKQKIFNSGGAGYLLDKVSLKILNEHIDTPTCFPHQVGFWEDVNVAHCLLASGGILPYDTRDHLKRERFHPFTPGSHLTYRIPPINPDWYTQYNPELKVGYECCSDESISFHYIPADLMRTLYSYVYHCNKKEVRNNVYP